MSEAECRQWILDTIDSLRSRKARPDLERICKMVQRRHGLAPSRTRRQLDRLLRSRTVLRVSYKGSHSYRIAAQWQPGAGHGREREREREQPQPQPQPQTRTVLTRARLRGAREQQQQQQQLLRRPAGRRRVVPETGTSSERKKTRRSKEADLTDEGTDDDASVEDQELWDQAFDGPNMEQSIADSVSEDHNTKETPDKLPQGCPTEEIAEELSTGKLAETSLDVERSPSYHPTIECKDVIDAEMMLNAEDLKTMQERLSSDDARDTVSSEEPAAIQEDYSEERSQETCTIRGESELEPVPSEQLRPELSDSGEGSQQMEDRHHNECDQLTCQQGVAKMTEVPEVSGASCLLTPSASPIDMIPEEHGPTDRSLLEENGKPVDPTEWSIADVVNYFKEAGFPEQAVAFEDQEIDGKSLLLMKRNDVLTGLAIKLGPALKIYEYHIKVLQLHHFNNEAPSS
ncbi:sterile alpha motif domain-containing protein 1-like isoform X2 [Chiloscyllium punctatum]|uniref:sterile alpha motif domain-containing protein 1-like isoform X2 n=1 Tax=Chiloscyllium punctatum TaxID=137246 RepID=UPI003B634382